MKLNSEKLTEIFVKNGVPEDDAKTKAQDIYDNNDTVMFRAVLWAWAKFGDRATTNTALITRVMDNGRLNEFQASAKIVHQGDKL